MGDFFGLIWTKILDLWDAVYDLFANLITDFRERNRYVKVKTGLITGYVSVSLATAIVFIPPGELNEIGVRMHIRKTEIVGGRYFMVYNESSDTWKNLVLTFNDRYTVRFPRLRPGKKKSFFFNKFKDSAGRAPSKDVKPRKLRIDCSEGAFERDFLKRR